MDNRPSRRRSFRRGVHLADGIPARAYLHAAQQVWRFGSYPCPASQECDAQQRPLLQQRVEGEGRPFASKSQARQEHGYRAREFARQCRGRLLLQARNVCRHESDAEDLVQEALLRFIQTFDKVEALPSERVCEAWLVTTLTNLFYDQCRRRKVRAQGAKDLSWMGEVVVEQEPRPLYDTLTDEQFAQALHALSPKLRATFELHAAGSHYKDIARVLGLSVGTVAKRLHDARTKLHEFLCRRRSPPTP